MPLLKMLLFGELISRYALHNGVDAMNGACSGFVFQNKFEKKIFDSEKGKASFIALAKAYFAGGGQQYTITVVSPEDLLDAQVHPERHRNLIVRVGGYSEYFVNLWRDLQDSVIKRTFLNM